MLKRLITMFRKRRSTRENSRSTTFRPELLMLEGRVTPANIIWVGNGMGNGAKWSVPANWDTNAVPGANDVAIFDGGAAGANTSSTMDMGGVGSYHIGKIVLRNGFNSEIVLDTASLIVDILDMQSTGTIRGMRDLIINQRTDGLTYPAATMFGTSNWRLGTIATGDMDVRGEDDHLTNLVIAGNVTLKSNLDIDFASTVKWTDGNIIVGKDKKVTNFGTFIADSPNKTMGTSDANDKWTFENSAKVILGEGRIENTKIENKGDGAEFQKKQGSLGQPGLFEIVGEFIQDAVASVSVESGTLYIDGPFTQSAGSVTVAADTTLEVTGTYDLSGGTVVVDGPSSASLAVGRFIQSGGATSLVYATLTSADDIVVSGGTITLSSATLAAATDVEIQNGGTLAGAGTVDVSSGALLNAGTITVGGSTATDTLVVLGDYTQSGVLNLKVYDSSLYDRLDVSGLATLSGALNVALTSGASSPALDDSYELVTYGSRGGTFGAITRPTLSPPLYWETDYGPNALVIWVDM